MENLPAPHQRQSGRNVSRNEIACTCSLGVSLGWLQARSGEGEGDTLVDTPAYGEVRSKPEENRLFTDVADENKL